MPAVVRPFVPLTLALGALVTSVLAGAMAYGLERDYRETHPFTHDSVSYLYHEALLHERVERASRLKVAADEWGTNFKAPLRTVPLILVAPSLLGRPGSHLATALPFFAVFLFVLGLVVHRRTGSVGYALGAMTLPAVLPGVLHPEIGLAAYWLDLHAAFLVGAALYCLVGILDRPDAGLRWYAGFAGLASLAVLARYVAVVPLLFLGAPLLAATLRREVRRSGWRAAARPLAIVGVGVGLLAVPFLLWHLSTNLDYLRAFSGFGEANEAMQAASTGTGGRWNEVWAVQTGTLRRLLSPSRGLPILLLLSALHLVPRRTWRGEARSIASPLWIAAGHLLLTIGLLRSTQYLFAVYVLPGLLLLALAPLRKPAPSRTWTRLRLAVLVAAVLFLGVRAVRGWHYVAAHPAPGAASAKEFHRDLAAEIVAAGGERVVDIHVEGARLAPLLEAYRLDGRLPVSSGLFSALAGRWRSESPQLDAVEIARRVTREMDRRTDLAVVYAEVPDDAFGNQISRGVAAWVAVDLERDPTWRRIFELHDGEGRRIWGYRNERRPEARRPGSWEELLRSNRSF